MSPAKARPAEHDSNNSDEANPYQRFFWVLVTVSIGLFGSGVYAFMSKAAVDAGNYATLTADLRNLSAKVDTLSIDLKAGTSNRYTGADAANDRAAMMQLISHNAEAIDKLQGQVADLREFKAAMESKGKP